MATAILALAGVAVASFLGVIGPKAAVAAMGGPDDDGRVLMLDNQFVEPGQTSTWSWNNTGTNASYFVDVQPNGNGCQIEMVRQWREQVVLGSGLLRIHYTIKNVGTSTCTTDVYLAWVN